MTNIAAVNFSDVNRAGLPAPVAEAVGRLRDLESLFFVAGAVGAKFRNARYEACRDEEEHHLERVCRLLYRKLKALRVDLEAYDKQKWADDLSPDSGVEEVSSIVGSMISFQEYTPWYDHPAPEINIRTRVFFTWVFDELQDLMGLARPFCEPGEG